MVLDVTLFSYFQIFTKTRKNQLRAEYPLSIMGALENEAALAQKQGRTFKLPISIPKDLYAMPQLAKVQKKHIWT